MEVFEVHKEKKEIEKKKSINVYSACVRNSEEAPKYPPKTLFFKFLNVTIRKHIFQV